MWSRIPIVRLLLPFVSGLLIFNLINIPAGSNTLIVLSIPVLAGGLFFSLVYGYRSRWLHGIFVITFIFSCGYYIAARADAFRNEITNAIPAGRRTYLVCLEKVLEKRERSYRGTARVLSVVDSISCSSLEGDAMLYFEPDSLLDNVPAGSFLLISAQLKAVQPPMNPHEFDYRKYLARKGIFHSAYIRKNEWKLLKNESSHSIYVRADKLRQYLLKKLLINGVDGKYFGISSALLLGEDSHLDSDIRDVYARAGAMHVLCVSGLHVGVIFLVLSTLLGFLKRIRMGRYLLPLLLMLCIWAYALLTGLAPPVCRASSMISFFIIGSMLGRQKNAYNTLAASAFLMIILEPSVIYNAGFQLSYSAVIGIISLQRPLENLLYFRYTFFERIWSITTVSIAAQIGTLPVVLYYFQQFPLYSLITNLIVIPLSSLIIYSGILLLMLPAPSIVATVAASIFKSLILIMDEGVNLVESIPYGIAENIVLDLPQILLMGAGICCVSAFLIGRHKGFFLTGICLLLAFSSYRLQLKYEHTQQQSFIVYSVRSHSAYDIIAGSSHQFIADSALLCSPDKIDYSIKPNWQANHLNSIRVDTISSQMEHVTFSMPNGQCRHVIIWHGDFPRQHPPETLLSPDFLILRGRCPFEIEQVFDWFNPGLVIIDSSVPPWVLLPEGNERFWDARHQGAYISE